MILHMDTCVQHVCFCCKINWKNITFLSYAVHLLQDPHLLEYTASYILLFLHNNAEEMDVNVILMQQVLPLCLH